MDEWLIEHPARDCYHDGRFVGTCPAMLIATRCRAEYEAGMREPGARDVSDDDDAWRQYDRETEEYYAA